MTEAPAVIAVVDGQDGDAVIWWVRVTPSPLDRMCGAWVLPPNRHDVLPGLVADRWVVATAEGRAILHEAGVVSVREIDFPCVEAAVAGERQAILDAFGVQAGSRSRSRKLVPLVLPGLPSPVDLAGSRAGSEPFRALGIARQIGQWSRVWEEIEAERLARPCLRRPSGDATRPIPGLQHESTRAA